MIYAHKVMLDHKQAQRDALEQVSANASVGYATRGAFGRGFHSLCLRTEHRWR